MSKYKFMELVPSTQVLEWNPRSQACTKLMSTIGGVSAAFRHLNVELCGSLNVIGPHKIMWPCCNGYLFGGSMSQGGGL